MSRLKHDTAIKKRIHLCLICPGYPPETHAGGVATYTFEAVSALRRFPIKITIISRSDGFKDSEEELADNVYLYRLGEVHGSKKNKKLLFRNTGYKYYGERLLKKVSEVDEKSKIDIIESCEWGAEAYFLLNKFSDRLIIRCQTPSFISEKFNPSNVNYTSGGIKKLEIKLLSTAPYLIFSNKCLINEIEKHTKINGSIRIEQSLVDLKNISVKKDYTIKSGCAKLLVVGRIEERKGQDLLFKALELLNAKAKLYVIGADTPGKNGKSAKTLFLGKINLETQKKIIFTGELPRQKVLKSYKDYDIFIAPSRFDLGPFTVLEAMSAGTPSIGYDNSGISEKIEHGKSGLLFNGDPADLEKKIELLINNQRLREKVGKAGRKMVQKKYSGEVLGGVIFNNYLQFNENRLLFLSKQCVFKILAENKNFIHNEEHILNVQENCFSIAKSLSLKQFEILALKLASHWHDTGRIDSLNVDDHEKRSAELFNKWAIKESLDNNLIEAVIAIILYHRNRGQSSAAGDSLSKIFWDADKLDIFNFKRIDSILKTYQNSENFDTEFNFFDSLNFWRKIDSSFADKFHVQYSKNAFKIVYPNFNKKIMQAYRKNILGAKKFFGVGGAEPLNKCFTEMNKCALSLVEKKIKTICYVPIALFNQPELFDGMDSYIDKIEKYYKNIDENIILTRISPKDSEKTIISKINKADIIYLSGGDTKYLISRLKNSEIGKSIMRAYDGGKILIGNSAGALSVSEKTCSVSELLYPRFYNGLALIKKYVFIVHYTNKLSAVVKSVQAKYTTKKLVKLEEEQAVFLLNDKIIKKFN